MLSNADATFRTISIGFYHPRGAQVCHSWPEMPTHMLSSCLGIGLGHTGEPMNKFIFSLLLFSSLPTLACSALTLVRDGQVVIAKNYDWYRGFGHGALFVNRRGLLKQAANINGSKNPARWESKYGSVTFTQFGRGFPIGGINEAGLVVEMLQLKSTQFSDGALDVPFVNEAQWTQYQLDQFATVEDVVKHINDLQIVGLFTGIHYYIADQSGNTAILEYQNGKPVVYHSGSLPLPVLTNHLYEESVQYYSKSGDKDVEMPMLSGNSLQRFSIAAKALNQQEIAAKDMSLDRYAWGILESVKMAYAAAMFEPTQWSLVYIPKARTVSFKTREAETTKMIKLDEIDFSPTARALVMDMNKSDGMIPFTDEFNKQLIEKNKPLLKESLRKQAASHPEPYL